MRATRGFATAAAIVALLLLAAACGQKAGVAGSGGAAAGALPGEVDGATGGDGAAAGDGDTAGGGAATGGGATGGGAAAGAPRGGGGGGAGPAAGGAAATAGAPNRTGISNTTIKIGIHAPITGAAAISTFEDGVGVYSDWAGQIKGLGNRKIEVVHRDDHFDPQTARQVCKELVENEKVFILIGSAGVDQIKSCAEYAASAGVPYFSPGTTEGPFRGLQSFFALSETYSQQNVQLAQLIRTQVKKKTVGMVLTDSPLLNETVEHFKGEASKNGLQVVKVVRMAKDASTTQADAARSQLQGKADVVYWLHSPTFFVNFATQASRQGYFPTYVAPGLSIGVNLIAGPVCAGSPNADVRVLHPSVQLDVIDRYDANYRPAYRQKNGAGSQPDDIGILLWGIEKLARMLMEADGADLSRQTLIKAIESGKPFASNVFATVSFSGVPHFGAKTVTLLRLACDPPRYTTAKAFASGF